MSEIPVRRFYSARKRRTARSIQKSSDNNIHCHQSNGRNKIQSISTSTPLVYESFSQKAFADHRSLSTSTCSTINDSGYADSLVDSTFCTPKSKVPAFSTTTCSLIKRHDDGNSEWDEETPVRSTESLFQMRGINYEFTPVSECIPDTKAFRLRRSLSREEHTTPMDFIQSDWEVPEEENVFEKFRLDDPFQEDDCIPKSKLNFESDFDDDDVELDYTNPSSGEIGLSERFNAVLKKFSPSEPDRLIGRKMGLSCVDIVTELKLRNISCVFDILDYLEPKDLCSMCQVNKEWKSICDDSEVNTRRRLQYLKNRRMGYPSPAVSLSANFSLVNSKENFGQKPQDRSHRGLTGSKQRKQILGVVQSVGQGGQNTPAASLDQRNTSARQDLFNSAASRLKNDESLQKCPKCQHPSCVLPVQERGQCTSPDCGFDYCTKCLNEFHSSRSCDPVASKRTKTDPIGGKKSKKNLRRL